MKLKHRLFFIILIIPVSLFAFDFGLTAGVNTGYGFPGGSENSFTFRGDLWPRFSILIGDNIDLNVSAGFAFDYNNTFTFIPELLRTEFSMSFAGSGIRAGRINYSDPLSFIASGLFDGAQYYINTSAGRFSAGVLYTGLLYKKTAGITMTSNDQENYDSPLDYSDFFNTYFAPGRIITAVDWSHPSVFGLLRLNASVLFQFDLSSSGFNYHSQYLVLKGAFQADMFLINAGGAVEFSQAVSGNAIFNIAFAADIGFTWLVPAGFNSALSFNAAIAGGRVSETAGEFTPITSVYYGNIFFKKMSGISVIELNYSARFIETASASLSMSYFIRNDLVSVTGYPIAADSSGYFLGPEIFARFTWMPFSDLQLNVGGGVFLPALGNAGPGEKPLWRIELNAVISVL